MSIIYAYLNKRPKFHPIITRIKLNPEQAVLQCSCYDNGLYHETLTPGRSEKT